MTSSSDDNKGAVVGTIAAVTFDITGTLIHSPRLREIYTEVLARHGIVTEPEQVEAAFVHVWREQQCVATPQRDRFDSARDGGRAFWRALVARLCELLDATAPPFAAAELYDRFAHAEAWDIYPDVDAVLTRLTTAGLRLGVISNWDHRLPSLLDELGLANRFDTVVFSGAIGVEKPHPKIFTTALENLGLPAGRVLHIGDQQLEDLEGAQAVGMRARRLVRDHDHALPRLFDRLIDTEGPVLPWSQPEETRP
ncbi:MAG: HAD-IA family hydrolase [Acidobacteriota bacterium]